MKGNEYKAGEYKAGEYKVGEYKVGEYKAGDTIYILLTKSQAESVLEEWLEGNWRSDLTVHRSRKTKGHVVIETCDLAFVARICQWHSYEKVSYKRTKKQ